jgi:hypothetical protein
MNEDNETPAAELASETAPKQPSLLRNWLSFIGLAIAVASLTSIGPSRTHRAVVGRRQSLHSPGDLHPVAIRCWVLESRSLLLGMLIERRRRRRDPDAHITQYPGTRILNDPTRRRRVLLLLGTLVHIPLSERIRKLSRLRVHRVGRVLRAAVPRGYEAGVRRDTTRRRTLECDASNVMSAAGPNGTSGSKFNGMHQLWAVDIQHL